MQFIENIFLLQCLEKEIATAKELDLRPLGKVIIFCYRTFLLYIDDPIIHVATTWQQLHLYYIHNFSLNKIA